MCYTPAARIIYQLDEYLVVGGLPQWQRHLDSKRIREDSKSLIMFAPRKNDKCFDWEGHSFVIRALLLPKYLWLATVNELWVDGDLVSTSGGLTFSDVARHRLKHRGPEVEIVLETRTRIAITGGLDYECRVDGIVVSAGILRSEYVWKQGR